MRSCEKFVIYTSICPYFGWVCVRTYWSNPQRRRQQRRSVCTPHTRVSMMCAVPACVCMQMCVMLYRDARNASIERRRPWIDFRGHRGHTRANRVAGWWLAVLLLMVRSWCADDDWRWRLREDVSLPMYMLFKQICMYKYDLEKKTINKLTRLINKKLEKCNTSVSYRHLC